MRLTATEWSHVGVLCVDLGDVCHPLAQSVDWYLVAIAVLELCSLGSGSLDLSTTVRWRNNIQQASH